MTVVKLEDARRVIRAAEKKAREIGQPINSAVADEGGNIVAHVRMDNAWIGSIDISLKRAYTSRAFDIETKELAKLSRSGGEFFGMHVSNNGKIMIFAGGVPLKLDGKGAQTAILRRVDGPRAAGTGDGGPVIVDGAPVSIGREAKVTEAGDTRFFAGWRSDPFFCDVEGAKNKLQFTGDDFFADKDLCTIVLEVPNSALGAKEVRLWARTLTPGDGGGWIQVERGARPAQAVILVEERDAYIGGEPADDRRFLAAFAHALEHTGGYRSAEAKRVAGTLLPDILPYDPTRPASFPDNGRTLTDDAFDSFIRILTNGKVTEDKARPHGDLLLEFPYVGPPHQSRVTKAPHKTTATQNQTRNQMIRREQT